MQVELIKDLPSFAALQPEWTGLLEHSDADCLFLTWEWLYTWWKHCAGGRQLCLLAVRDGGDLAGLAPLAVSPSQVTRLRLFRALEFLGTDGAGSDYLDVLCRRGREQEVADALAGHLAHRGTMLELAQVNGDVSLASAVAARLAGQEWVSVAAPTHVCPFVGLAGHSWESYLGTLGPDHRYNVRRRLRNLTNRFDVQFAQAVTDTQRRTALSDLIALHLRRWRTRGGSTAFSAPAVAAFHEEFSQLAMGRGWLRLFVLRLNGTPAAAWYGFRYGRRFYFYQSGFDPEYSKHSVGLVMMALSIKHAIEEGAGEYDFLHGDEPYKFHWAQDVRELQRLELYPPRLGGWLGRSAVETGRAARRMARRLFLQIRRAGGDARQAG